MSTHISSQDVDGQSMSPRIDGNENPSTRYGYEYGYEEIEENVENKSLIKTLHEYQLFQKKNMTYGKKNPYKEKTNKLNKVKQQFIKLISIHNFENFEKMKENEKSKKKSKCLTSRAAMWNEAEKQDQHSCHVKLTSSTKKSFINIIINNIYILLNCTLSDKKGKTYFATFMIFVSIFITLISNFRNEKLQTYNFATKKGIKTVLNKNGKIVNSYDDSYNQLKPLFEHVEEMEKETNKKKTLLEFLHIWKNDIKKSNNILKEKEKEGETYNKDIHDEDNHINTSIGKKWNYIKIEELKNIKKINEELKKKIYELEKKLVENKKEIEYFKNLSLKEIEQFKQKIKEEMYGLQNKYDDYVNNQQKQNEGGKKNKDNLINALETKINKNEMKIKESIISNVESAKNELLQIIKNMQKKIEKVENDIIIKSNTDYSNEFYEKRKETKNQGEDEKKDKNKQKNSYTTDDEEEKKEKKKTFSFWEKKEINFNEIQKELNSLKNDTKKFFYFLEKTYPAFEENIKKQIESKIKDNIDLYKKEIIKEFAKVKLEKEENLKLIIERQEKLQKEIKKNMNEQIQNQIKNVTEDIHKFVLTTLENKNVKYDKKALHEWSQTNLSAVEILQQKVDELYNEFILDYNQIDWALESLGAKIVQKMTTSPLNKNDWVEKFMNRIVLFLPSEEIYGLVKPIGKDPSIILRPHNFPGECFSFKGQKGKITIHLPATIDVSSISIQHVHENISNNPNATPKYFSVYGIIDTNWPEHFEQEDINFNDIKNMSLFNCLHSIYGKLPSKDILEKWLRGGKKPQIVPLGDFYFDRKKRVMNFITKHCFPIRRVIFEFTENYGANYTCVYRVKVHGKRCIRKT